MITGRCRKTIPDFRNKFSILLAVVFMYVHVGFFSFNEDFQFVERNQTGIRLDCVEMLAERSKIPHVHR